MHFDRLRVSELASRSVVLHVLGSLRRDRRSTLEVPLSRVEHPRYLNTITIYLPIVQPVFILKHLVVSICLGCLVHLHVCELSGVQVA